MSLAYFVTDAVEHSVLVRSVQEAFPFLRRGESTQNHYEGPVTAPVSQLEWLRESLTAELSGLSTDIEDFRVYLAPYLPLTEFDDSVGVACESAAQKYQWPTSQNSPVEAAFLNALTELDRLRSRLRYIKSLVLA
jgi:hypothetical protein